MIRTIRFLSALLIASLLVGCGSGDPEKEFRRDAFNRLNKRLSTRGVFNVGSEQYGNVNGIGRAYCGVAHINGTSEAFVVTEENVVLRSDGRPNFDEYSELHCPPN